MKVSQKGRDPKYMSVEVLGLLLDDIEDVEAPSPSDKEALIYEAASGKWKPKPVHQVGVAIQTQNVSTNSPNFVDIPNMSVTLTIGASPCLIIFSASAVLDVNGNWGCSRLLIDGVVQDPGSSGLGIKGKMGAPLATRGYSGTTGEGYGPDPHTHAFSVPGDIVIAILDFATVKTLTAGQHTFKVQWRSDAGVSLYCRAAQGYEHMVLAVIELKS